MIFEFWRRLKSKFSKEASSTPTERRLYICLSVANSRTDVQRPEAFFPNSKNVVVSGGFFSINIIQTVNGMCYDLRDVFLDFTMERFSQSPGAVLFLFCFLLLGLLYLAASYLQGVHEVLSLKEPVTGRTSECTLIPQSVLLLLLMAA